MVIDRNLISKYLIVFATLTVFSSSLFYNRIEGVLVVTLLCFAFFTGFKSIMTGLDKSVVELLCINIIFAFSLVFTAVPIFARELTAFGQGIEYFVSVVGASILGCILYCGFVRFKLSQYLTVILVVWGALLSLYCVWYLSAYGGRVYDILGRYVFDVGFPYTLFVVSYLAAYQINSKHRTPLIAFLICSSFFIVFYGIQSRALTIALLLSLSILAIRYIAGIRLRHAVSLFVALVSISAIAFQLISDDRIQRYSSIMSMLSATFSSIASVDDLNASPGSSKTKTSGFLEGAIKYSNGDEDLSYLARAVDEKTVNLQDGSLQLRYKMLMLGAEYVKDHALYGHGNMAEKELLSKYFKQNHPHLHNQYLSYLVAGGIVHLTFGIAFSFGMLFIAIRNFPHIKVMQIAPIFIFIAFLLFVGSHNQQLGFQNLYILYTFILLGMLNLEDEELRVM